MLYHHSSLVPIPCQHIIPKVYEPCIVSGLRRKTEYYPDVKDDRCNFDFVDQAEVSLCPASSIICLGSCSKSVSSYTGRLVLEITRYR